MLTLATGLMVVGVVQALLLALALLLRPGTKPVGYQWLVALLLMVAVDLGQAALYMSGGIREVPHLLRVGTPAAFLLGPLLYFFLRARMEPSFRGSAQQSWHWGGAVLCVVYLLPLYVSSAAEKAAYLEQMYVALPFDSYVLGGAKRLHLGGYLIGMVALLWQKRAAWQQARWLGWVVGLWAVSWGGDVYEYLFDFRMVTGIGVAQICLIAGALLVATVAALRHPAKPAPPIPPPPGPPMIAPEEAAPLLGKVRAAMEAGRWYRSAELTLPRLAEYVALTPHELSHLLNAHLGQNFAAFVNQYRVREACEHLTDSSRAHLTIAAIAEEVGFNSASAFNAAFKRFAGTTPSRYRKENAAMAASETLPDL